MRLATLLLFLAPLASSQPVHLTVHADSSIGAYRPIWPYFGYDEPNYTYTPNGQKLIGELGKIDHAHIYIRTHNMLTTGDGTPALKWGSTNAYTLDSKGRPVYDWTIVDRIIRTYLNAGTRPFVEIGFMPKALSTVPEPYQHDWPKTKIAAGWAYPPKDYAAWAELIYQWVRHSVATYGEAAVNTWYWEVWNEPDIEYWQGTAEEYDKLYDFAVDAVKRAAPGARVGGPATTSPSGKKAAAFLQQFLQHCENGTNFATGKLGSPLDFISYHAKGRPDLKDGHVEMGLSRELRDTSEGMRIVTSFPKFHDLPIILSEADPEGCAACSARTAPANAYRNGSLYPAYTAVAMSNILKLADEAQANVEGMLTWAFEFENQPYFDGFRTLATNGVDKPVLNVFRMASLLGATAGATRVKVDSNASVPLANILESGVRDRPDLNAIATRSNRNITVMAWNYIDEDVPGPDADVQLTCEGLPKSAAKCEIKHYRIDETHSNAYTVWKAMGSPQNPTPDQQSKLEAAGHLDQLEPPQMATAQQGKLQLRFALPRQAVSLIQVSW